MTPPSNVASFRNLHASPEILVLANCWDGATARLTAALGARAIATSSAAVAWSHGYPDGDALPLDRLITTIDAIKRVTDLPLSVDAEGGYSADPEAAAGTVARIVEAGAAGINLEEGAGPPDLLAAKIARIKARTDVYINARTDLYLRNAVPPAARMAETIARAALYRGAGADGLFVPGLTDPGEIRAIVRAVELPLNVLAWPGLPPREELAALGVRRLSAGSAIAQVLWTRVTALARAFLTDGRSDALVEGAAPYGEINASFR